MKKCIKCNKLKSLDSFVKSKDSKDGRKGTCKACSNDRLQKRRTGVLDEELKEFRELHRKRSELENRKGLCTACGQVFTVAGNGRVSCQSCTNTYKRNNYGTEAKKKKNDYYLEHKDAIQIKRAERYFNNPEYQQTYQKEYGPKWATENKGKRQAITRGYQASKLNATPKWVTKDMFLEIERYYLEAVTITEKTGILMHVDHMVPLQGKTVCGLHVPWNLQVLTAIENCAKHNKLTL